jgi:hypothetical protein
MVECLAGPPLCICRGMFGNIRLVSSQMSSRRSGIDDGPVPLFCHLLARVRSLRPKPKVRMLQCHAGEDVGNSLYPLTLLLGDLIGLNPAC